MSTPPAQSAESAESAAPLPGWIAERSLDATETLAVLLARAPELRGAELKAVGSGWDNDVWEVHLPDETSSVVHSDAPYSRPVAASSDQRAELDRPRLYLRVPRRAIAADLPRFEAAVLSYVEAHVAAAANLRVPSGVRLLEPSGADDFPWPLLLLQPVPGEEVARLTVPDDARAGWAESLGRFLRRLHSIDAAMAEALGAPPDLLRRLDVARYRAASEQRLAQARAAGVPGLGEPGGLEAALGIDADACAGLQPRPTALCHGDLHLRHVLCDPERFALTGVIDWGDVHIGDPAIDLAIGPLVLPAEAWPAFRAAYGDVTPDAWRLARLRAWFSALALVVYGHDVGEHALVGNAVAALHRLAGTLPPTARTPDDPPRCAAVLFARGFHHAGVHYVDADAVQQDEVTVRLLREGRVVWQGTAAAVADVRFFADRHAALDFHRRRGRGLQQASGPRGGSTAKTERATYVEGVRARLRGDEDG